METYQKPISVLEPVGEALAKTKILLFKPFNLEKWFIIGFCAWLANLISKGIRPSFNFISRTGNSQEVSQEISQVIQTIKENILLIGIMLLIIIAIVVVLLWLSSRGHFMFVDCLAKNKGEIVNPWKNYKQQGNSLFWFRLILGIISTFAMAIFCIPMVFMILALRSKNLTWEAFIAITVLIGLVMFGLTIFLEIVRVLTIDFVVPIMYLNKIKIIDAWRRYLPILGDHFWITMLYLILKVVVFMAVGIIKIIVFLIGCCMCCASFLLFIPYIGTVIYLPFFSFLRLYPLCFLKQFGSEYDVFAV